MRTHSYWIEDQDGNQLMPASLVDYEMLEEMWQQQETLGSRFVNGENNSPLFVKRKQVN